MRTVLVVDDKEMMRDSVATTLQRSGFTVVTAPNAEAGLQSVAVKRPDVVVTDMRMPGMSGMELLEQIRRIDDDLPVILMTAFGTIETAVKAMRLGAFDYVTKPFEGDELIITVKRAIEHRRLLRENAVLKMQGTPSTESSEPALADIPPRRKGLDRLIGESTAMKLLREQVLAVAKSHGTVLVTGESGAGKEVVARAVHEISPRSDGPFLAVNCAALSPSLLESELFGHERGAFTGAEKLRKGRFELADNGTLLLDEVSEVDPQIQAKLLRVLQERQFERVGSSLSIGIDVRLIATSNRDLPESVKQGEFRQDLYFRLNVLPIIVPPLRERADDIVPLSEHFVREICRRDGRATMRFAEDALELMKQYSWPGNVRELQNICERAVVLTPTTGDGASVITADLVRPWLTSGVLAPVSGIEAKPVQALASISRADPTTSGKTLEEIERDAIVSMLMKHNGHRQKTAKALGIGVRTLGLKLKKWKEAHLVSDGL
jgi:DNA-binding NtrC family response regulator